MVKNVPILDSVEKFFRGIKEFNFNPINLLKSSKTRHREFTLLEEPQIEIIGHYIEKRRSDPNKQGKNDILNLILNAHDEQSGYKMSDRELCCSIRLLLAAGYETTAHSMAWFLYCLATYPEYQKKLQIEVDSILGSSKFPTPDQLSEMKLLVCFINESMRMYPVVPQGGHRDLEEDADLDGHFIPKGTEIWVDTYSVHYNEKYWKNPREFYPERFENPCIAFMPFTLGPRNCIGQTLAMYEMKAIGASFVRNFNIKLAPGFTVEEDDAVTVRPKGCNIYFESRL